MGDSDPVDRLAKFLDGQQAAWKQHLQTFGNAHWHIINYVWVHGEDGVTVRRIYAHLSGVFGMDMSTCVKRLQELIDKDLLHVDSDRINRASHIVATPDLVNRYDAYCVEVANLMLRLVFDDATRPVVNGPGSNELSDMLHRFFTRFGERSQPEFDRFIRKSIPQPARRERASRSMPTYGYWQATFICWKERLAGRSYVFVDDLHFEIYPVLQKSPDATRQIVNDLIGWGFLVRRNREDGVPKNRFAVCLTDSAFELYCSIFERGYELLVSTSREVVDSLPVMSQKAGTVVPLKRPAPRNLADAARTDSAGAG